MMLLFMIYGKAGPVMNALRAANLGLGALTAVLMIVLGHSLWTINDVNRFFKRASNNLTFKEAPGSLASKALKFLLPRKTYERLVLQIIADHREEYFEALWNGEKHHASYIVVRMHAILTMSLLLTGLSRTIGRVCSAASKLIGPS
ncbi:hypothetical protein [Rhizobium leguminosarum]|nr:hypothetical protein [Rhizobium leguminosarum]